MQRQLDQVKNEKFRTEAERDELKHKAEEAEGQVRELYQKCRELSQENQEIPILRDSLEEMKYLQSKVVSQRFSRTALNFLRKVCLRIKDSYGRQVHVFSPHKLHMYMYSLVFIMNCFFSS